MHKLLLLAVMLALVLTLSFPAAGQEDCAT